MYLRLAFAVAAFLQPDVLIVDEVLAVGDAEFQRKCLGKMEEVSRTEGRTVIFVSHNLAAVNRLCNKGILLREGRIEAAGDAHEVTSRYLMQGIEENARRSWGEEAAPGDDTARLRAVRVFQEGASTASVDIRRPVTIAMDYTNFKDDAELICVFSFLDEMGTLLFISADLSDEEWSRHRKAGDYRSRCTVPGNLFAEGVVRVAVEVSARRPVYHIHLLVFDAASFQVVDSGEPGSVRGNWGGPLPGVMRPACAWETSAI